MLHCSQIPAAHFVNLSAVLCLCLALCDCRPACSSSPSGFQGEEEMLAVVLRSMLWNEKGVLFSYFFRVNRVCKKFPYFEASHKVNITSGSEIIYLTSVHPRLRVICTHTASRAPNFCNLLSWKELAIKAHQTPLETKKMGKESHKQRGSFNHWQRL